ncbi:MAG: KpsF/GutQ family sugar-phosphate isomerase [Deltaproteobacteria bacterium]|nr:KpsF/GutQ family sugar-phosphate isomerase [Deltaproteobacteria bacterium]
MNASKIIETGINAIKTEIQGLEGLIEQVDASFARAVDMIAGLKGKVVLTGVGKSGIIAKKVASTMVSTGTPAIFLHPLDSLHGDLGAVSTLDLGLMFSNSGKTKELLDLISPLKQLGIPIISITGDVNSPLARSSDIVISCKVKEEACGLGLAPTASTTAQIAMGDALAVVVSSVKGFDRNSFKALHPAGELGKQLMSRIKELMITGEDVPIVKIDTPLAEIVRVMTEKSLGFTLVEEGPHNIIGIITDGDLRRAILNHSKDLGLKLAGDIMTPDPKRIEENAIAIDALDIMEKYQITSLVVTNESNRFLGVVHLHDLLGRGKLSLKNT